MFTHFCDMHSGGSQKEQWAHIFIEASEDEAKVIFYNRFGHNPERVTCTCCGDDYSIHENENLQQATAYYRGCTFEGKSYVERQNKEYRDYQTLEQYLASGDVLVIYAADIKPDERIGEVPEQGYVW